MQIYKKRQNFYIICNNFKTILHILCKARKKKQKKKGKNVDS